MSDYAFTPCRDFPLQMWLWLSGEMPAPEQQFWQRHVQACSRCREMLATAQSVQKKYAGLPLYAAPESLIQKLLTEAKPSPQKIKWPEALGNRISAFFDFKPRLAFAGVVLAIFLITGFHYFAFQPKMKHTWEARAFDQKAAELSHAIYEYHQDLSELDEQLNDLNYRLTAMAAELENAEQ
jgi:hypothetical protein